MENTTPVCFYCRQPKAGHEEPSVAAFDRRVRNMKPCDACKKQMTEGVILIEVVDSPSLKSVNEKWATHMRVHGTTAADEDPQFIPRPPRTGNLYHVDDSFVTRLVERETAEAVLRQRWTFIQASTAQKIGLRSA